MALCLLVADWMRGMGGHLTALTVDHGLRPDSRAEAERVGVWLAGRGIPQQILNWTGPKPAAGIQEKARHARYRLMEDWCRDNAVLHLCLAHHLDDQTETHLMRRQTGSGPDGLAAMSAVVEKPSVRLLRPLLDVSPEPLRAGLREEGQEWIEDPTNVDPRFRRARLRARLKDSRKNAVDRQPEILDFDSFARQRAAREKAVSALLGRCCAFYPAGYAVLDRRQLAAAPAETSRGALAQVLKTVGGSAYAPGNRKMERFHADVMRMQDNQDGTLGRCRFQVVRGAFLMCREDRHLPPPLTVKPGDKLLWDNRFSIQMTETDRASCGLARLAPLGVDGWRDIVGRAPYLRQSAVPYPARLALPALTDDQGVFAVPHLLYKRETFSGPGVDFGEIRLHPSNSLSGPGFFVALRD